jgi:hypothetical protein
LRNLFLRFEIPSTTHEKETFRWDPEELRETLVRRLPGSNPHVELELGTSVADDARSYRRAVLLREREEMIRVRRKAKYARPTTPTGVTRQEVPKSHGTRQLRSCLETFQNRVAHGAAWCAILHTECTQFNKEHEHDDATRNNKLAIPRRAPWRSWKRHTNRRNNARSLIEEREPAALHYTRHNSL